MKILHVNYSDIVGGAARAAYRIHTALMKNGLDSKMMVAWKVSQDKSVIRFPLSYSYRERRNKYAQKIVSLQVTANPVLHSLNLFPSGMHKEINASVADIVHLHWINYELISIPEVAKITKPIVWTLHDMWAFSGAEHYDDLNEPARYQEGYLSSNRPAGHGGLIDIDRWTWQRKKKHWAGKKFHFVTPSQWLAGCLHTSALFQAPVVQVIPNPLDTENFKPVDRNEARKLLGLPADKMLILTGTYSIDHDLRKGIDLFREALNLNLHDGEFSDIEIIIFGSDEAVNKKLFDQRVHDVGRIEDDRRLAMLYCAADVFIIPSRQDNLPNTVVEALACGTPCVAFRVGGMPDMIDHQVNGYLAEPFDTKDLARGIQWVLRDSDRHAGLCSAARKKAEQHYGYQQVCRQYSRLYEEVLCL